MYSSPTALSTSSQPSAQETVSVSSAPAERAASHSGGSASVSPARLSSTLFSGSAVAPSSAVISSTVSVTLPESGIGPSAAQTTFQPVPEAFVFAAKSEV